MLDLHVAARPHVTPRSRPADVGVVDVPASRDRDALPAPATGRDAVGVRDAKVGGTAGPFERLLGCEAWSRLDADVRRRFNHAPVDDHPTLYAGTVTCTELSRAGRLLARLAAIIGTPLPETDGATGPASVSVSNAPSLGGQVWTRVYGRDGRFPQVVHSVKRFAGPTGLEEYVGRGIGMTLRVTVERGALVFSSVRYFLEWPRFAIRLYLPRWAEPGRMRIVHHPITGRTFRFTLDLEHRAFGHLIHQDCIFTEV